MKKFYQLWLNINTKIRLVTLVTLTVSLIMSSLTFWALNTLEEDSILTDSRFSKDLGLLFAANVTGLVEQNNIKELVSFFEKIYLSTSSIRYIQLFKMNGDLLCSLPLYSSDVQKFLQLHQNLLQIETQDFLFNIPVIHYSTIFHDQITNITIPLIKDGKNLGTLDLGINPNPSISSSSKLIQYVSLAIFVSIWLMVIIGAAFNAFTITEPLQELLVGIKRVASGDFSRQINSKFKGDLGDLIVSFNEMAERLESYEKYNVQQLASEQIKLEALVSTIVDGAILVDTELRLLFVNQTAIKVFNWYNKDIIGTVIFNNLPSHVNDALLPVLNNLIKSNFWDANQLKAQEVCVRINNGFTKTLRLLLTIVLDKNRKILTGIAITIQDITREVQLNEAKNQFISNVSHELRTPLCNIGLLLETLIDFEGQLSKSKKMQYLNIAFSETQRLSRLVNDVLDLSHLEYEHNYNLQSVDLLHILSNISKSCQITAANKNIKIVLEFAKCVKGVLAHESSLFQILSNLLGNSMKFTHSGGQIILRVYPLYSFSTYLFDDSNVQSFNFVRIEVIDEGIGIDRVYQNQIFDRFMRIENSVHILEGTGLGLSIVKNIIQKYKSRISVYSELSIGTSIWFDLAVLT
uniref:Uncharacterized sensor-like histidine kinase ycf26 n=1 Tax=Sporolithon durum TaxID=48970 RepID=A0A141SCZ6_9FLOR|nr:hypothetical protein Sdur_114 [Sporolithon durum]AMK96164.1 hypothetical protein Sdur_114 [Sporolithon durum]